MLYLNKLIDICINRQESQEVVNNYDNGSNDVFVRTNRTDKYKYYPEKDGIFCCKNPMNFIASQSPEF